MRISYGTVIENQSDINGYGYAASNMRSSLARLGYEIKTNDPSADVEIWFDQPWRWNFSDGPYKIGYHPWESTRLPGLKDKVSQKCDWVAKMNECDEIWTPSDLVAQWYVNAGITVPVYVYEHGVSEDWAPVERKKDDKMFRFLHVGAESARKGATEVMKAFRFAFGEQRGVDVMLTMKIISEGWNILTLPGIEIQNEALLLPELVKVFQSHHAFVYPSWGEGFGLNPLQALATGMPTIIPSEWAPYRRFIMPELNISSRLHKSPWPGIHPGNMLEPNMDELVHHMRYTYDNYEEVEAWHRDQAALVAKEYSWDRITETVFTDLENRLKNS